MRRRYSTPHPTRDDIRTQYRLSLRTDRTRVARRVALRLLIHHCVGGCGQPVYTTCQSYTCISVFCLICICPSPRIIKKCVWKVAPPPGTQACSSSRTLFPDLEFSRPVLPNGKKKHILIEPTLPVRASHRESEVLLGSTCFELRVSLVFRCTQSGKASLAGLWWGSGVQRYHVPDILRLHSLLLG